MKVGPKSSLRSFLHRALQLLKSKIQKYNDCFLWNIYPSHNDNTTSTELTCNKAFSYAQKNKRKGVVDFTSCPRQHGVRISLFKSFKILRMQVFRPRIELQKF